MHPAAWIVWGAGAGMVCFSTTNPFYLSVAVAAAWVVYAGHRVRGPTARSFGIFAVAGLTALSLRTLLVLLGPVDAGSVTHAVLEGARLAALLVVFGAFNAVTDPYGIVRMAPRRFHEPALAAALALSIAPRTVAAVGTVREAQRLRGLGHRGWRAIPALAVPVLESGLEDAVTLAESMDARGHGRGRRSRYRPRRWRPGEMAVAGSAVVAGVVFLGAAIAGNPSLHSFGSPEVQPLLLGAAALLAAPGLVPEGSDR
jgi:energy-coupling factor transport system permease protein